jgi:acetyl-CoA synthetase
MQTDAFTPAWYPDKDTLQQANITQLMQTLGIDTYAKFHQWSCQHRDKFWQLLIEKLSIQFSQHYTHIYDLSQGVEQVRWLPGAQMNIVDSCLQAPADKIAIHAYDVDGKITRWSYQQLTNMVNRVANSLRQQDYQVSDAIAICMPMTAEAIAIYLGIIKAGCCVVSIADSFSSQQIDKRCKIAKAKAIFTQDVILRKQKSLPLYSKIKAANTLPCIVLAASDQLETVLAENDLSWADFLCGNTQHNTISSTPQAHTNILFSSGTTGEPKAIPWDHTTPIKCATDAYLHHDIHAEDILAWPTNLGWMMGPWLIYAGLINQASIALYYGAPIEKQFGKFVEETKVTMLGVIPSMVRTWRETACMVDFDWQAIKKFSSSGECSNPEDMLYLMQLANNRPVIEYCGGTEIGGAYITSTLLQANIPGCFSTPALGMDFLLLNESDCASRQGEVAIIPPSIGLSTHLLNKDHHQVYYADMPNTDIPLRRHGDHLIRLQNGYYRALGRVDDTMNLGGIKTSAVEIENIVNQLPEVFESVAISVQPEHGGPEQLIIFVVSHNEVVDCQALQVSIQKILKQELNPLFKVHAVHLIKEIPRTASNKIMRRVLREKI